MMKQLWKLKTWIEIKTGRVWSFNYSHVLLKRTFLSAIHEEKCDDIYDGTHVITKVTGFAYRKMQNVS